MTVGTRVRRSAVVVATVAALMVTGAPAVSAAPGNDDYANAIHLDSEVVAVAGNNVGATLQDDEYEFYGHNTVWYEWTSPITGIVNANLCTSDFDTVLAVYVNPDPEIVPDESGDYSNDDALACGQANEGGFGSSLMLAAVTGVTYALQVRGFNDAEMGSFCLSINRGRCGDAAEADNTPAPIYEAVAKGAPACDSANGWAQSWQQWAHGGTGGAVCERTIIYSNALGRWVVARFNPDTAQYDPVPGATVDGSTSAHAVKAKPLG